MKELLTLILLSLNQLDVYAIREYEYKGTKYTSFEVQIDNHKDYHIVLNVNTGGRKLKNAIVDHYPGKAFIYKGKIFIHPIPLHNFPFVQITLEGVGKEGLDKITVIQEN